MTKKKVAVVTGGNRGIGFEIVKGLCRKFDGEVYLTARDANKGQEAVKKLECMGFHPKFHQLDLLDQCSVDQFRDYLIGKHGGINILINNAGISVKKPNQERIDMSFGEQARVTLETNYFGTLRVCKALFPLLRQNAKVVNVSSSLGHVYQIPSADIRSKFCDKNLDIPGLTKLMYRFIRDSEEGKNEEKGWGSSAYAVSKVGVSALSIIQQRMFDNEYPFRNIHLNFIYPGYVMTDTTGHQGEVTPEEGAKTALCAALETDFKGKYIWPGCKVVDWYAPLPDGKLC